MPDEISMQILSQTSENIQKLFDVSTRIDERVKLIQQKQSELDSRIESIMREHNSLNQKIAVLESNSSLPSVAALEKKLEESKKEVDLIDRRLINVEYATSTNQDRWSKISAFVIQLIWIVIAAWVLFKLNLNAPPVP